MEGLEFYIYENQLWVITEEGKNVLVDESNKEMVQKLCDMIREYFPAAYKALAKEYQKSSFNVGYFQWLIVRRFYKCNFGKLDPTQQDIEKNGKFNFEKVDCPLRGECKLEGIVCGPKFNTSLSQAEERVMRLLYEGRSKEEIAEALFISPCTVKNHIISAYCKLGVHEKADFIRLANERNLFH